MQHGVNGQAERVSPPVDRRSGALLCRYDADNDFIRVECDGLWTPDQVDESFVELGALIDVMRMRHGRVRVFVDRRRTGEQSPETAERLRSHTANRYEAGDRVAVLVDTCLAKLQSRSSVDERTHTIFISENAAMLWLRAHD